jgi:hypothetical protein
VAPDDALLVVAAFEDPGHAELEAAVAAEEAGQEGRLLGRRRVLGSLFRFQPLLQIKTVFRN